MLDSQRGVVLEAGVYADRKVLFQYAAKCIIVACVHNLSLAFIMLGFLVLVLHKQLLWSPLTHVFVILSGPGHVFYSDQQESANRPLLPQQLYGSFAFAHSWYSCLAVVWL